MSRPRPYGSRKGEADLRGLAEPTLLTGHAPQLSWDMQLSAAQQDDVRRYWGRLDALSPDLSELFWEHLSSHGDATIARALAEDLERQFLAANFGPFGDIQHLGKRLLRAGQPHLAEELRNLIGRGYAESPRTRAVIREEFEARLLDDASFETAPDVAGTGRRASGSVKSTSRDLNGGPADTGTLGDVRPSELGARRTTAPPRPAEIYVPEGEGRTGRRFRKTVTVTALTGALVALVFAVASNNGLRSHLFGEKPAVVATLDLGAPPAAAQATGEKTGSIWSNLTWSSLVDGVYGKASAVADTLSVKDVIGVKPVEAAQSGSKERTVGRKLFYDRVPTL